MPEEFLTTDRFWLKQNEANKWRDRFWIAVSVAAVGWTLVGVIWMMAIFNEATK